MQFIFNSLLHRAYDVYGQIDKKKALAILSKPKVDTETEKLYIAERLLKTIGVPQGIK